MDCVLSIENFRIQEMLFDSHVVYLRHTLNIRLIPETVLKLEKMHFLPESRSSNGSTPSFCNTFGVPSLCNL